MPLIMKSHGPFWMAVINSMHFYHNKNGLVFAHANAFRWMRFSCLRIFLQFFRIAVHAPARL